jgi:hypothetical protein
VAGLNGRFCRTQKRQQQRIARGDGDASFLSTLRAAAATMASSKMVSNAIKAW